MIRKNDQSDSLAGISRQAATWWLWMKDQRRLSLEDSWHFLKWLMRSRRHLDEFLLIRRQDEWLTRLLRPKCHPSNVTHVNWWQGSSLNPPEMHDQPHISGWKVAASVLVMLSVIVFLSSTSEERFDRTVVTAAQEPKTQHLEDGSLVSLDTESALRVQFTDHRRDVHLFQGKASFDVVMDMKRPFVVNTFLIDIAAVESKFVVAVDTTVEVRVYEGMVAISGRGAMAGRSAITVKKGQTYRVPVDEFGTIVAADSSARSTKPG